MPLDRMKPWNDRFIGQKNTKDARTEQGSLFVKNGEYKQGLQMTNLKKKKTRQVSHPVFDEQLIIRKVKRSQLTTMIL